MFKAGDKVKRTNGDTFSNGKMTVTVERVEGCRVWLKETCSWLNEDQIVLVCASASDEIQQAIDLLESKLEKILAEEQKMRDVIKSLKAII
ncbi:hypothetical protein M5X02_30900 [Paenibacillus alvei]|uniref:hypothetical protein n=1 Tax=Paenibacillus alvei TaxID=44250 RepID=UPI00028969C6|nr:hypothetical protein [Paenibacillus alvei]EJW14095.1 hypothetical protein PAV_141p02010 [Paenibacillus alvei DSM 29]MCY9545036.1 hypothetical protein [Paenibacillus alvei]MCY9707756.1 hypothetical protein [Paenibacillus alvei]MEC0082731.1 hypothetical protein [Paenibacillus alvei]